MQKKNNFGWKWKLHLGIGVYFNQSIKIIVFHASTNGVSDLELHINYSAFTPEGPDEGDTVVWAPKYLVWTI